MGDIFVFGGGSWGRALLHAFSINNNAKIISRRSVDLSGINASQISKDQFLQSYTPSSLCIIAISTQHLREFLKNACLPNDLKILCASKGIEQGSGAFIHEILEEFFLKKNLCYLAGPTFAKEVLLNLPCAFAIHSNDDMLAKRFADIFPSFMKPYLKSDIIGAQVAGAYKNVIAIASGISDGLKLGSNAKASLVARGLVEMSRFGLFFGAKIETFLGLSGSGDLFLTSNSILSRNYRVGLALAENKKLEDILDELKETAEGVCTTFSINEISRKNNLHTPIASELEQIFKGRSVEVSLKNLLNRV